MPTIFITSADYGPLHGTPPASPHTLPHTVPPDALLTPAPDCTIRVRVNEATHEIGYENEGEDGVTLVVKPKGER